MVTLSLGNYTKEIPRNFSYSVALSGVVTFGLKMLHRSSEAALVLGAVAALAAAINGLINPLLKKIHNSSQINFFHDAAYKVAICFTAQAIATVFLPAVSNMSLLIGLVSYLVIKGVVTDFSPVDLNRTSTWILL
ncbi:MAG: hypothetical protein ACHQUC_05195 [Chlamydiales bacterium]